MVTGKLICDFVFAYTKRWFSHDPAQICGDEKTCFLHIQKQNHRSVVRFVSNPKDRFSHGMALFDDNVYFFMKTYYRCSLEMAH